jgi:protein-tyrosine phosphatase
VSTLRFDGLVNARDVGGIPAAEGRRVRTGVLYRSETPQLMTAADVQRAIDELGIRTVVDLRGSRGSRSMTGPDVRSVVLDFLGTDPYDTSPDGFLAGQLDRAAPAVGEVLTAIVESPGATLVHCHTGKDRTGFTIAVILAALGVDDVDIIADYERSSPVFTELMDNLTTAGLAVPPQAPAYARHAPSTQGVTRMLQRLRSEWPEPGHFLLDGGVQPDLLERARAVLLE